MKQFFEIAGLNATNEDFEKEGYRVISFGKVKETLKSILKDMETAHKFHLWNDITEPNNKEMQVLNEQLNKIVFKESRGNKTCQAIGWENGISYLRYHSGIFYNWFKN